MESRLPQDGKNSGDCWSGTGVAYHSSFVHHSSSHLLLCGIAMTPAHKGTKKGFRVLYVLSGRIPHHATIEKSQKILESWRTTLNKGRVLLGLDANETFHDPDDTGPRSNTGGGVLGRSHLANSDQEPVWMGGSSRSPETSRTSHGVHVWNHRLWLNLHNNKTPILASPPWQDPSPWQARGWTDSRRVNNSRSSGRMHAPLRRRPPRVKNLVETSPC